MILILLTLVSFSSNQPITSMQDNCISCTLTNRVWCSHPVQQDSNSPSNCLTTIPVSGPGSCQQPQVNLASNPFKCLSLPKSPNQSAYVGFALTPQNLATFNNQLVYGCPKQTQPITTGGTYIFTLEGGYYCFPVIHAQFSQLSFTIQVNPPQAAQHASFFIGNSDYKNLQSISELIDPQTGMSDKILIRKGDNSLQNLVFWNNNATSAQTRPDLVSQIQPFTMTLTVKTLSKLVIGLMSMILILTI